MRAGFYESDITPPLGSGIPGPGIEIFADGIKHKLFAKALVLENDKTRVAFLALDALGLPISFPDTVRKRVAKAIPIEESAILMAAIHIHTGPPVKNDEFKTSDTIRDQRIIDTIAELAADAVILAYQRLTPCKISYALGCAKGISFVRQYLLKDGTIRTNPANYRDEIVSHYKEADTEFPLFFITDEEGAPMGSISSFALHHDTVGGTAYSNDYSGRLADNLKKIYGQQFISLFFAGFCGDINHLDYCSDADVLKTQEIADILTKEFIVAADNSCLLTDDTLLSKTETVKVYKRKLPEGFIDSVKYLVENPPDMSTISIDNPYSDQMKFACARKLLARYDADKSSFYDVPVQVIRLGDCLIYSLVGEMFSHFAHKIRAASPTEKNLMIELAHSDKYRCYIPTPELFKENFVYESTVYSAVLEESAGDKMSDKAIELGKEIYK